MEQTGGKKYLFALLLLVCVLFIIPMSHASASGTTITVNTDNLTVRNGASLQGEFITTIHRGEQYPYVKKEGEWIQILLPNGKKGWVADYLVLTNGEQSKQPLENARSDNNEPISHADTSDTMVTVNTDNLTVRNEASLQGEFITTIHRGEQYPYMKKEGEWIQILLPNGEKGWVADYLVLVKGNQEKQPLENHQPDNNESTLSGKRIFITHNGTNIRKNPNTLSTIITRANKGNAFEVIELKNDWYKIKLQSGQTGYVAQWLVTENQSQIDTRQPSTTKNENKDHAALDTYLQGKKIVIDPGHGGKDYGTTGISGTLEKNITMETATRLYNKLKAAGADVILTRYHDQYVSLPLRVSTSTRFNADAFISIHYDSFNDGAPEGATTFFYHPWQKDLAVNIHSSMIQKTNIHDRGVRKGDYYVIRENNQHAVLVELGFLSNPSEELLVTSEQYQMLATTGIYEGLARYFKNQH